MRLVYLKPELEDLSQGSRISFARQIKLLTQDYVSDKLGITGDNKRRTMTRYEKGERNPKDERTREIAKIIEVNYNSIKEYNFKNPVDIIYILMWLEEITPNINIELPKSKINDDTLVIIEKGIDKWKSMKSQREQRIITYKEYIEWKLTFDMEGYVYDQVGY